MPTNSIGKLVGFKQVDKPNIFMIDETSVITVRGQNLDQSLSTSEKLALLGNEIISFTKIKKHDHINDLYEITGITRGKFATEKFMGNHVAEENFIILNANYNIVPVDHLLENQKITLKCSNKEQNLLFKNKSNYNLPCYITKQEIKNNYLHITWLPRIKDQDLWQESKGLAPDKFIVTIISGNNKFQYETKKTAIKINISKITLSGSYEVDIVMAQRN